MRKSEYRYDLLNRQIYVRTLDGKEQENFYDGEGLRAGLRENGKHTTFLFHNGEIIAESDGESTPVRRYVRGNSLSYVQTAYDNAYHAFHQDEQGSTVYITGQDRTVENCYQYDAFGNLTEYRETIANRILYTGQQYDQETGQYYLRARYYNPVVGRFLQEDTYRGDGLNLYAYCANNPVMYYDPSGHIECKKKSEQNEQPETPAGQVGDKGGSKTGNPVIDNMQNRVPNSEVTPPNKRGNAPISNKDGKPIEIHHNDQEPLGPFDERHPSDHRYGENYKKNHPNYNSKSKVDRTQFREWKREYWEQEWDNGRWND